MFDSRSFADALFGLEGIVARFDTRISGLGTAKSNRRQIERLTVERDAVAAALEELRESPAADDTADVTDSVMDLAEWLNTQMADAGVRVPIHPYAGARPERQAAGGAGHCWVCATVGHQVAHPERSCADVRCTADHSDDEPDPAAPAVADRVNWADPAGSAEPDDPAAAGDPDLGPLGPYDPSADPSGPPPA